ncbi:MAG: hypothetical protein II343_02170, partial [Clostridia bacterium]|nr:hypothetical protein [Clostridia bacterium]
AGYTKKGSEIECTSKLVPRFQIFFLARFTRAITRCVIGLPHDCVVSPARVRRFAAAKRRSPPHKPTKRQSAELCSAGLRSKLKKAEKISELSLLEFLRFSVFFNKLPRLKRSQQTCSTGFLFLF